MPHLLFALGFGVLVACVGPAGAAEKASRVSPAFKPEADSPFQRELVRRPLVIAAGRLEIGQSSVRLAGILVTEVDAECGAEAETWPCGRVARAALQRMIRRRSLECQVVGSGVGICGVGGKDLGEWLVTQGWARAEGPAYAELEKEAKDEARGIWSPKRPGLSTKPLLALGAVLADLPVRAEVSLSSQMMTLVHRGEVLGQWPVSTARDGKVTPTGIWRAQWLSRNHRSSKYDGSPMPFSVFYDGDYAIHGTYQTGRLGRPASAGCVRLDPEHAKRFFDLVRREGLENTLIVIGY